MPALLKLLLVFIYYALIAIPNWTALLVLKKMVASQRLRIFRSLGITLIYSIVMFELGPKTDILQWLLWISYGIGFGAALLIQEKYPHSIKNEVLREIMLYAVAVMGATTSYIILNLLLGYLILPFLNS
ncbi:MAG: hypothetical protein ACD_28C00379G0003 [uncultured bacterium]|nr:MAG: hypothetical protein ACD_28C00379G0003 [uncultured bacterium]KKT74016.1 MAG: hypothetical protein UW70_C0069G0010 [Candidatus Peregrinibacteria bacterium GW2011_GWA2_44_7]